MSLSLVTLARMEAAAMQRMRVSPLIINSAGTHSFGSL
jgi:hypothetical protein